MSDKKKENKDETKKDDLELVKENRKNMELKQERNAKIMILSVVVIVGAIFIFGWVLSESKKFDYIGLTFEKEIFGDIPIYTTHLTGKSIYNTPVDFKVVLREDPRKSTIPFNGGLNFINTKPIYWSLNTSSNIQKCDSTPMSAFGLFTGGLRWNLETVITTEEGADKFERPNINCDTNPDATVLILTKGDETKIAQEGQNCYVLNVNSCEDLNQVIERFEIETLSFMTGRVP